MINIKNLYKNWFIHNVIGHPLMQILKPFKKISSFIHDVTLPECGQTTMEMNNLDIGHDWDTDFWDTDLSTCKKCGDKDWIADRYCDKATITIREFKTIIRDDSVAKSVMFAFYRREHGEEPKNEDVEYLTAHMGTALLAVEFALD